MRSIVVPSAGDVVCARTPGISLNSVAMSPGAFSILVSIWSRSMTRRERPGRRCAGRCACSPQPCLLCVSAPSPGGRCVGARDDIDSSRRGLVPVLGRRRQRSARGQRQRADAGRVGRGGDTVCRDGRSLDRHGVRHDFDADHPGSRLCRIGGPAGKAEAERKTSTEEGGQNGMESGPVRLCARRSSAVTKSVPHARRMIIHGAG